MNVYLEEDEVPERLLRALAAAPIVSEADIDGVGRTRDVVSAAEVDVLRYASRGLSKAQIAVARGVSLYTVQTQARNARYKLCAKTLTQACCEAIRRGLIP